MAKTVPDMDAARELSLWATSTAAFYDHAAKPAALNLARKIAAGTYDADKAPKLWEYAADKAAEMYAREFAAPIEAGDWNHSVFNAATRRAAAVMLAESYDELVSDMADDLKAEKANRQRWTIAAIREANAAAGFYFFSPDTLRFWGDKVGNWSPRFEGPRVFIERVKRPSKEGEAFKIGERREFNPDTGDINFASKG